MEKEIKIINLKQLSLLHRIGSEVKRVAFVSYRMSHIVKRSCSPNIIV